MPMPGRKGTLPTQSPSLDTSSVSLARAVQTSMASLYALQTALILRAPDDQKSALLSSFKTARQEFHNQCGRINEFLQSCQTLSEHYAKLLEYTKSEEQNEYLMFAENVDMELQGLQEEMKSLISSQTQRKDTLVQQKNGIANVLNVPINKRKPGTAKGKSKTGSAKTNPSPQTPDPETSFHDAFDALDIITSNLNDISSFWTTFATDELSKIRNPKAVPRGKSASRGRSSVSVDDNVRKWRAYHAPLSNAVFIISEASDAVLVEPPVTSKNNTQPGNGTQEQITGTATTAPKQLTLTSPRKNSRQLPERKVTGIPVTQNKDSTGSSENGGKNENKTGKFKILTNIISSVLGKFGVAKKP